GVGPHGVAYQAEILAIRADTPGSCATSCSYSDTNLANAVDYAVAQGADVINLSLGGEVTLTNFNTSIINAVTGGVFVVISAGNDGFARPSQSALVAWDAAIRGDMIIAGASDATDAIASFNNDAGAYGSVYLTAPGVDIIAAALGGTYSAVSGTSFSAPHIAGAAALLKDQFPSLTGPQIAQILLSSGRDAGAVGVDTVFGSGILDVDEAFDAAGSLSVTSTGGTLGGLDASTIDLGPSFGDALTHHGGLGATIVLDAFGRPYLAPLDRQLSEETAAFALGDALTDRQSARIANRVDDERLSFYASADDPLTDGLWLNESEAALHEDSDRDYESAYVQSFANRVKIGFAVNADAAHFVGAKIGADNAGGAFLSPSFASDQAGLRADEELSASFSRRLGEGWRATFTVAGETSDGQGRSAPRDVQDEAHTRLAQVEAVRRVGDVGIGVGVTSRFEAGSVLGSRSSGALALGEAAQSTEITLAADKTIRGLTVFGEAGFGRTTVDGASGSLLGIDGPLMTTQFRLGITGQSALAQGDVWGLGLAQPLRVENGTVRIDRAIGWDYSTSSPVMTSGEAGLSPSGRALDLELFYRRALLDRLALEVNLLHQLAPGHVAAASDETHALVRFVTDF
ncbi:MAG: S8 family serine peptidase, partial [Pseudomonadota bacterium]